MTATQNGLITQLRRTIAGLEKKLDACTAELRENKERYARLNVASGS